MRYQKAEDGSVIGVELAQQLLDAMGSKSSSQPAIARKVDPTIGRDTPHVDTQTSSETPTIRFNQEALRAEERRLSKAKSELEEDRKYKTGLLLGGIAFFVGGGFFHRNNRIRRTTRLVYELNETALKNQSLLEQSLMNLAKSQMIWRVVGKSSTYDWKRNAGAAYLVSRTRAFIRSSAPPRVESNVAVKCIDLGASRLYFLPDMILYWQSGTFGNIGYDELALEQQATRFIEDEQVASDSIQVGQTWRYVKKDGGPDRRFNNNVRIPIMQYGAVTMTSSKGLNILLNASNVEATAAFMHGVLEFQSSRRTNVPLRPSESPLHISPLPLDGLKVLGLEADASLEKVSESYRNLAQM